jgi:uncharacterized protein YbaA (DUF1428 family)
MLSGRMRGSAITFFHPSSRTSLEGHSIHATRVVEAWGDDVPDGKVTDYKGAVKATSDEKVVYACAAALAAMSR